MGLARGGVTEQGPVSAIIVITNDKVEGCKHGKEKSLELQESMTPVGGPFGGTELGTLGLGREVRGLCSVGILVDLHLATGWKRKKKKFELLARTGGTRCSGPDQRRSGLWTPVDARDRAGPATLDSHGGGATRRLGVTGLITSRKCWDEPGL